LLYEAARRRTEHNLSQGARMLWTIAIILLILWLLGAFVVNLGSIVHLLLVIALVVIVYRLVTGRRPVV
jgi:fatty acid desaturase